MRHRYVINDTGASYAYLLQRRGVYIRTIIYLCLSRHSRRFVIISIALTQKNKIQK